MKAGAFWVVEELRDDGNAEPGMPLTRRVEEEGMRGVRLDFFIKVAFVFGLGALLVVVEGA